MRAILDARPSEGTLLGMVAVSCLLWFLGRWAQLSVLPESDETVGRVQAEFVSATFFRALGLYLVAGLAGVFARAFGGAGSWRDSRAAVFWAALCAAPISLAGAILALWMPEAVQPAVRSAGSLVFAVLMALNLAEAHKFASNTKILSVVAGLLLVLAVLTVSLA